MPAATPCLMGAEYLDSGAHAFSAGILPTAPSPSPWCFSFWSDWMPLAKLVWHPMNKPTFSLLVSPKSRVERSILQWGLTSCYSTGRHDQCFLSTLSYFRSRWGGGFLQPALGSQWLKRGVNRAWHLACNLSTPETGLRGLGLQPDWATQGNKQTNNVAIPSAPYLTDGKQDSKVLSF